MIDFPCTCRRFAFREEEPLATNCQPNSHERQHGWRVSTEPTVSCLHICGEAVLQSGSDKAVATPAAQTVYSVESSRATTSTATWCSQAI
jgi:hypothetical protein